MRKNIIGIILIIILAIPYESLAITNQSQNISIAPSYSNSEYVQRIENQYSKGWCVVFAVCNSIEAKMKMQGLDVPEGGFSKAWLYTKCKEIDDNPDNGTYIGTALSVAIKHGLCPDYLCPTKDYLFQNSLPKLTEKMDNEASKYKIDKYYYIDIDVNKFKEIISSKNYVLLSTMTDRANWFDGDDLVLPTDAKVIADHTTFLAAFDDNKTINNYKGFVTGINSWGSDWGNNGCYSMSYDYITKDHVKEAWTFEIFDKVTTEIIKMKTPMQLSTNGSTLLPFRELYESMGAEVTWYINNDGKLVTVATMKLEDKTLIIESTNGSDMLKITTKRL